MVMACAPAEGLKKKAAAGAAALIGVWRAEPAALQYSTLASGQAANPANSAASPDLDPDSALT
jgi:hypothetical protein